jgi:alkaline phosphatase D
MELGLGDWTTSSSPEPAQLLVDFYIENAGSNQTVFSRALDFKSSTIGDWNHYHIAVPPNALDAYAGKTLGICFRGTSDLQSIDNVRLETWPTGLAEGTFSNDWNSTPDQVWPGPGYWGNRLHDWEVASNRINAVGASGSRDRRTLHRVGTSIRGDGKNFHLSVRTGLHSGSWNDSARTGFLIGSGFNLDWRASLLVHDAWGRDFGLFCGMRGNGAAVIEDYSNASTDPLGSIGVIPATLPANARIEFDAVGNAPNYDLTVSVYDGAALVSQATATVSSDRVLGSFGLLSHMGGGNSAFWFDDFTGTGGALEHQPDRQLAIVGAMHTLSRGILKLTAQMMPFDLTTTPKAFLDTWDGNAWNQVAISTIDTNVMSAYNATFRIDGWNDTVDTPYRVRMPLGGETFTWEGTVRKDPIEKPELVVCGLTGQRISSGSLQNEPRDWSPQHVWHPHVKPVGYIQKFHPDIIAATGDQIYEGQPTPADNSSAFARHHDYLGKWIMWLLQWRNLGRDVPMIVIPDDHDVYQGNLWGEGGVPAAKQEDGGYVKPAEWVKMVERTMVSNLPDSDPYNVEQPAPPIEQGIKTYFTGMVYGRIGIAVIEDRKFKTGKNSPPPENEQHLLGQRQHDFLDAWALDWSGQDLKFFVSQSPLANLHTHAGSGYGFSVNDKDTHGWPVHRRNEAWEHIRKSFSFQLAGDQHLATVALHGVDEPRDAGYSFTVPAFANFFPRCWDLVHNAGGTTGIVSPYKGDFFLNGNGLLPDGVTPNLTSDFPHHFNVLAAGNPEQYYQRTRGIDPPALHDRGAGYGIVRIEKATRKITFECWPRFADPDHPTTGSQYPDWPISISQFSNYGKTLTGFLPAVETGSENPVIIVTDEYTDETVYGLRIRGDRFLPPVFSNGTYRIDIYEGDAVTPTTTLTGQTVDTNTAHAIDLFDAPSMIVIGQTARLRWQVRGSESLFINQGVGDVSLLDAKGSGYVDVSPTSDTTYTLTSNGDLQSNTTVRVFNDRETWRTNHFTLAELADPQISGDDADPDVDGIDNWVEHLLGGDPRTASTAILPVSRQVELADSKRYAVHEYNELLPTGEAAYEFQAGNDLVGWETIIPPNVEEIARVPGVPGVPDRVTARQLPPFEDDVNPQRFYRLKLMDLRYR